MAFLTHTYTGNTPKAPQAQPAQRGRHPRRQRPIAAYYERPDHYADADYHGSHRPIDTSAHWAWSNPLNLLPALLLALFALALVAMVWP